MDLALIEKLMRMLEQSSLQELDVTEAGMRLRLAKKRGGGPAEAIMPADEVVASIAQPELQPAAMAHRIVAGMAGTFYRAPAPGAAPFVTEGDVVEDGHQLAIIEAMKMLNPVESDIAGTVVRILLEDGDSVTPGAALFEIEPR